MKLSQRARLLAVAALCGCAPLASAQMGQPTHNELHYADVTTDSGDAKELNLDLWLPQQRAGRESPVVLWIHGGGWQGGTHNNPPAELGMLLDRGFAVASVEYRLSGESIAPAQIHDLKGAVRYLRANADQYNLDSDWIAAWGSSAGGHLTALLATSGGVAEAEGDVGGNLDQSSTIQAAVDYFGPTDLLNMEPDERDPLGGAIDHDAPNSPESRLIGFDQPGQGIGVLRDNMDNPNAPFPEKAALVTLMNPITHVDADDPPVFIAHGDQDGVVPFLQSVRLARALALEDVPHRLVRVPDAGHGFLQMTDRTHRAAVGFLTRAYRGVPEPATVSLLMGVVVVAGVGRRR